MKRVAIAVLLVVIAFVVGKAVIDARHRSIAEEAEAAAKHEQSEKAVDLMCRSHDALPDWSAQLAQGREFMKPVLSIELERLWLSGRPILFRGELKDVATHDSRFYVVKLRQGLLDKPLQLLGGEFGLRLMAEKQVIDELLREHPDVVGTYDFLNSVAVVADIDSVAKTTVVENETTTDLMVGVGTLVDLVYTEAP